MHCIRRLTHLELLLHCTFKSQCGVQLPSRSFTRSGRHLPNSQLSWDSLKPDKVFSVDEAVDVMKAAEQREEEPPEPLDDADPHLSLSAEDAKFLRSGLSPLGLLGESSESPGAAASVAATSGNRPPGSPHWGRVSEPAARPHQAASTTAAISGQLNPIYAACAQRDWARVFLRPPTNPWQELIQLTAEGKLWHYPIDNEQGRELEPDGRLPFQQHVLLESHMQDWVPKTGPVRHFMETVCIGLSKNAHLTAAEKAEHLDWYRRYFADKLDDIQARYADSIAAAASPQADAGKRS